MSKPDTESLLLDLWVPDVERCGFILESRKILEVENVHPQPELGFQIPATEAERPDIVATWHTHPKTGPNLSMVDYYLFLANPKWFHYIVARDKVWCYLVRNSKVLLHEDDPVPRLPPEALP